MEEKRLTVSVAAYNVEGYLEKALQSCLVKRNLDWLEVLIENDGSTDNTAGVAEQYQDKYPNVFRLINKENGGYGSTINRSVKEAKGKYFKQLDGDDWFDTDHLDILLDLLAETDVDVVVTQFCLCYEGTERIEIKDRVDYLQEGAYLFDEVKFRRVLNMHSSTIKTDVLRDMKSELREHCLYTDLEFINYPIPIIKDFYVCHFPVYMYRLGREGQSISKESVKVHYKEHETVLFNLIGLYKESAEMSDNKKDLLLQRIVLETVFHFRYLFYLPDIKKRNQEIDSFLARLRTESEAVFKHIYRNSKFVKLLMVPGRVCYPILKKESLKRAR